MNYSYPGMPGDPFAHGMGFFGVIFGIFGVFWFIFLLVFLVAYIVMAVAVHRDAKRNSQLALGLNPWVWTLLSLVMPVAGMVIYWLMNRSRLVAEKVE